jgi:hypothetical protein
MSKYNFPNTRNLKTGYVYRGDTFTAMLVNPMASYAGGSGPLWAVEMQVYQCGFRDTGYIRVQVVKVDEVRKLLWLRLYRKSRYLEKAIEHSVDNLLNNYAFDCSSFIRFDQFFKLYELPVQSTEARKPSK